MTEQTESIRVMIADDSAVIRGLFTRVLESDGDIRVVASVGDGALALKAIERTDVDLVLLDIEMPNMDGLTALPKLLEAKPDVVVVMASALTERNADISLRALRMGATDYATKPGSREAMRDADEFKRDLVSRVWALGRRHGKPVSPREATAVSGRAAVLAPAKSESEIVLRSASKTKPEVLAIGSSTGGPRALAEVLRSITKSINLPILITQHLPPTFTSILATHIGQVTGWPSAEARDGDVIESHHIYIAPGGYHMLVESKGSRKVIRRSDAPPENFCKPAVDPMLRIIADVYGLAALVVIRTGMCYDGRNGGKAIIQHGGAIFAQDKASSVVWGMSGAVATSGLCSAVLPLKELGPHVSKLAA